MTINKKGIENNGDKKGSVCLTTNKFENNFVI